MARLIIDTSLGQSNLALAVGGEVYSAQVDRSSQQAEWLVSEIDGLMQKAEIDYSELTELMSAVGPGSFTGIRVGLAAARALLLAYPEVLPYSISSLHAMAQTAFAAHQETLGAGETLLILNRAGKGELYAQRFKNANEQLQTVGEPLLAKPEMIAIHASYWLAGNGVSQLAEGAYDAARDLNITRISASALLTVPLEKLSEGAPEPLYIRPPDAVKAP